MQSETTLVWTEGRVELDSVTPVDGDGTVISLPGDSEGDDSLWDLDDLEGSSVLWLLLEELGTLSDRSSLGSEASTHWLKGRGDLVESLLELWFWGEVGHCELVVWMGGSVSVRVSLCCEMRKR